MKTVLVTMVLLSSPLAFAGNSAGNGGMVLVCSNIIRSLDLAEIEERGFLPTLRRDHPNEPSAIELALRLSARVGVYHAATQRRLNESIRAFERSYELVETLEQDDDTYIQYLRERDCEVEAAISQQTQNGTTTYKVLASLWNKLSLEDQATLIFHEAVYRQAISQGSRHSLYVRLFVGIFASELRNRLTPNSYSVLHDLVFHKPSRFKKTIQYLEHRPLQKFSINLKSLLSYPPAYPFVWSIVGETPSWFSYKLKSQHSDLFPRWLIGEASEPGDVVLQVEAARNGVEGEGFLNIRFHDDAPPNNAPVWTSAPAEFTVDAGTPFLLDMRRMVRDPEGEPLSFMIADGGHLPGPADRPWPWLHMHLSGILYGIPTLDEKGSGYWTVEASDIWGRTSKKTFSVAVR